ncbi:MAG: beta-ketoacyl-ACP synthase 3 [Planctomycetota bacterium]
MAVPQELLESQRNGRPSTTPTEAVKTADLLAVYRAMRLARVVDRIEQELCAAGEAFFHVGGAGHEAAAALNLFFEPQDWLHGHYRDKALMLGRGVEPQAWFDSVLCNAANYSAGRQMSCFLADKTLNLPSTVVPVGNNALQAVGIAMQVKDQPGNPIVLCGLGDGTSQQGEVMEAIAQAVRDQLPVLFWIQDNGYAISTQTSGNTFYNTPGHEGDRFFGLDIHHFDGTDILPDVPRIGELVGEVRALRSPRIGVMHVERLCSHSNADDQRIYRLQETIDQIHAENDPIENMRKGLIAAGEPAATLETIDQEVERDCRAAAERARRIGDPVASHTASRPLPEHLLPTSRSDHEYLGSADPADHDAPDTITMIEAMREVLGHRLANDERVTLYGEDIEDPKGDVFGVTKGLSTKFPGRVVNSPLAESTIIGTGIGRAIAGGRPVGFIQFADFLPTGIGQLLSEVGTMYWRTNGQFECPLILMITCGAYRPGLGPFHSQTLESIIAHMPGIDVMMPSSASDAAAMLNAAFESGRPTVFLYPKVCLNDRAPWKLTSKDVEKHLAPVGVARVLRKGNDLTLVAWGSTVTIGMGVAEKLDSVGIGVDLIDLRCIAPWDRDLVLRSARKTGKLLVVHEDNLTLGFGSEILATVLEKLGGDVKAKRVTRSDTYTPCNYTNQLEVLPSYRRTLTTACELLGLSITWPEHEHAEDDGLTEVVEAEGSSPADQAVTISAWKVKVGDAVASGQLLAEAEADKAVFEINSRYDGTIAEIMVAEEEKVDVGTPLLKIRTEQAAPGEKVIKRQTREDLGHPVIGRPAAPVTSEDRELTDAVGDKVKIYLSPIQIAEGRDKLTNERFEQRFPEWTSDDIIQRTGIASRPILAPDQTAVGIGAEAARKALAAEGLTLDDLTGIVCHTTTPPLNTPSMACMILRELDPEAKHELMVYDVNAACSGWLYALDTAYHTIITQPHKAVLVVTTEALSRVVDPKDFGTAILFGDAASATIVRGSTDDKVCDRGSKCLVMQRPVLSGKADKGNVLTVGFQGHSHVHMDGQKVFVEAVRAMTKMVKQAFEESGLPIDQVDWLVPHQANSRIAEAVRARLKVPHEKVIDLLANHGNTSSSSIPLSICKSYDKFAVGDTVGVCAFGGGFTFGAGVMTVE